ncbi:MAG: Gfo/Idh/MocA family oxidoreductase, partial [Natronospirillum sp.]
MSVSPIRVGLIGFGLSGRIFHTPFILDLPDFALTVVQSRQESLVQAAAPKAQVVSSSQALIEHANVDLVVITAPNDLHFSLAHQALLAG